ncbi:MAG: Obg family GTPase CgtA [Phycisphaerales bacterium]
MFVDRATITVRAGNGGPGAVAFRRMKYEPKGGPNGGNGGHGGDVIFEADEGRNTLLDFRGHPDWEAQDGEPGGKKQCTGGDGQHCIIRVPVGTLVYNQATHELMVDMNQPGQRHTIARGGRGGFGNEHYKSATNQTPTHAHEGFPGERFTLKLELKLLADVGLVGLPNAGKSTLLAALTRATPKIADYPFTTLAPQLGVAELDGGQATARAPVGAGGSGGGSQRVGRRRIVIADLPGLIEGASQGLGLGHDFLRHIERTRVIVHVLDAQPSDSSQPAKNYKLIRKELAGYSDHLAQRDEVIVLNKVDLIPDKAQRDAAVKKLRSDLKLGRDVEVLPLSGAAHMGTQDLLERLWTMLKGVPRMWEQPEAAEIRNPKRERRARVEAARLLAADAAAAAKPRPAKARKGAAVRAKPAVAKRPKVKPVTKLSTKRARALVKSR